MSPSSPKRRAAPEVEILVEESAWNIVDPDVSKRVKRATTLAVARASGPPKAAIAILLSNDEKLRTLNRQHRGKDKPTNVLSFPSGPGSDHLGDIAIAYGTAQREAEAAEKPLLHHLLHLTVHGVLHLLGYDHEEPAEADRMETLEAEILVEMGIPDPYQLRGEPA